MRIQKYLAQLGMASRREAEKWIEQGRVSLDGQKVQLGQCIDPDGKEQLRVNGKLLLRKQPARFYFLFHKPDRYLTSRAHDHGYENIYDIKSIKKLSGLQINPVGRLDYRTEGLLLLTNDGQLNHALCHPSSQVPRSYLAYVSKKLSAVDLQKIKTQGVELGDGLCRAEIKFIQTLKFGQKTAYSYRIVLTEGRNRVVRRLFEAFEARVFRLVRNSFASIELPQNLKAGQLRELKQDELAALKLSTKP